MALLPKKQRYIGRFICVLLSKALEKSREILEGREVSGGLELQMTMCINHIEDAINGIKAISYPQDVAPEK